MHGKTPLLDVDDDDLLSEFFASLTWPDAPNPDGWFAQQSSLKRDALSTLSQTWHMNHWLACKKSAERTI